MKSNNEESKNTPKVWTHKEFVARITEEFKKRGLVITQAKRQPRTNEFNVAFIQRRHKK